MKTYKFVILSIWLVVLIISLIISRSAAFNYLSLICWWFVMGWLFAVWGYRLKDIFSLKLSFGMFILGGVLVSFGLSDAGEMLMKFAFIVLLTGFIQSLVEYKKSNLDAK